MSGIKLLFTIFFCRSKSSGFLTPPATSHHGGVWERCIRSVQKILNSVVRQQTLDDESLTTFMCEVENIINSRPLTAVSNDVKDLQPLKARFHYERGKKHSLFVLLLFFALASILTARFNQRSIKETENALFHARSENGP